MVPSSMVDLQAKSSSKMDLSAIQPQFQVPTSIANQLQANVETEKTSPSLQLLFQLPNVSGTVPTDPCQFLQSAPVQQQQQPQQQPQQQQPQPQDWSSTPPGPELQHQQPQQDWSSTPPGPELQQQDWSSTPLSQQQDWRSDKQGARVGKKNRAAKAVACSNSHQPQPPATATSH